MHNSSLVAIAQYFGPNRTSVLYGNRKKFNTEAVNDYPPIRFEIRFERKFSIVGLYFLTLPVETLRNLCPVEKLFGMRMAGLCQFYWRTCSISIEACSIRKTDLDSLDCRQRILYEIVSYYRHRQRMSDVFSVLKCLVLFSRDGLKIFRNNTRTTRILCVNL